MEINVDRCLVTYSDMPGDPKGTFATCKGTCLHVYMSTGHYVATGRAFWDLGCICGGRDRDP